MSIFTPFSFRATSVAHRLPGVMTVQITRWKLSKDGHSQQQQTARQRVSETAHIILRLTCRAHSTCCPMP